MRSARSRLLAALCAGLAVLLATAGSALGFSCSFGAGVVTLTMNDESVTLSKGASGEILVNGVQCSTATTSSTDEIDVNGLGSADDLGIDMQSGPLEPGATAEGSGTSEIEIVLTGIEQISLIGSTAGDSVRIGTDGINVNDDDDADVLWNSQPGELAVSALGGNDTVSGKGSWGTGADYAASLTIDGGDGNDQLLGGDGDDQIDGGLGDDLVAGQAGDDTLIGGPGTDDLTGGGGNDRFDEGAVASGADSIMGEDGHDVVDYSLRTAAVHVSPGYSNGGEAGEGDWLNVDIEEARGGSGNDTMEDVYILFGNGGDDTLSGLGSYYSILAGGDGNDTFVSGVAREHIAWNAGVDALDYSGAPAGVTVNLVSGLAFGGAGSDDFFECENVIGSVFADVLTGDHGPNTLNGNGGDDTIADGAGADRINGGDGNDTLQQGSSTNGADDLSGGAGTDTVDYSGRTSPVSVTLDNVANDGEAGELDNVRSDVENRLGGDGTPPTLTPVVTGKTGQNGWYRGAVTITWTVTDPESTPTTTGCDTRTVASDTKSVSFSCEATSTGGTASETVTVKVDLTPPAVTCKKAEFVYGQRGAAVQATVSDRTSGPAASKVSRKVDTKSRHRKVALVGTDKAGNSTTKICPYSVVKQVTIGMPFAGKWAYNVVVRPPYTDNNSSHPSVHWAPGGGNWATDLYSASGTAVYLRIARTSAKVTFTLRSTWDSCKASPGRGGRGISLNVYLDGSLIGWVSYAHLDGIPSKGPYTNGMKLGQITSEPYASGCYTASHTHFELKNTASRTFACWTNHGNPGKKLGAGTAIGILGAANRKARQACSG